MMIHIQYWSIDGKYRMWFTLLRNGETDEVLIKTYISNFSMILSLSIKETIPVNAVFFISGMALQTFEVICKKCKNVLYIS